MLQIMVLLEIEYLSTISQKDFLEALFILITSLDKQFNDCYNFCTSIDTLLAVAGVFSANACRVLPMAI